MYFLPFLQKKKLRGKEVRARILHLSVRLLRRATTRARCNLKQHSSVNLLFLFSGELLLFVSCSVLRHWRVCHSAPTVRWRPSTGGRDTRVGVAPLNSGELKTNRNLPSPHSGSAVNQHWQQCNTRREKKIKENAWERVCL